MNLEGLNKEQLKAAETINGPVMVFAGAGTGKTKTLTSRIIHMVKDLNISPSEILAITFTKKATNEMRERIYQELGNEAYQIYISTIHSMCSRILRRDIDKIGYQRDFEIIDEEEAAKILSDIYKEEQIDKKQYPIRKVLHIISDHKNNGTILSDTYDIIFEKYQDSLFDNNMLDFDDLLLLTDDLFFDHPEVLEKYHNLHKYILVDEFQDTNEIQYSIIKRLVGENNNIFVVGDDDQSIYSFRGATSKNMFNFLKDYPDCIKIILNQNYRSTNIILKGANSVILNNNNREKKELYSLNPGNFSDVNFKQCFNQVEETRYVCDEISKLINKGYKPEDFCILYRNGALSLNFEKRLKEMRIPYKIYGGFSFFKRKEIKDVMSFFRFILDDTKQVHFRRIVNIPSRGIGDKTIEKIFSLLTNSNQSVLDAILEYSQDNDSFKHDNLIKFREMILSLREKMNSCSNLVEYYDLFLETTGYLDYIKQEQEPGEERDSNVLELRSSFVSYEVEEFEGSNLSLREKIQYVFDQILLEENEKEEFNPSSVTLSTVHSAKGLEFKVCFIVALEEGIFPSIRDDTDLEEERRVAYVAMTRPKEKIYLTYCTNRMLYGRVVRNKKSRFLDEYFVHEDINDSLTLRNTVKEIKGEILVGDRVYHKFFGYGTCIKIDEATMQIVFDRDESIRMFVKNTDKVVKCED